MKKLYTLLLLAAATLTAGTLASCDEDLEDAVDLSGEWTGQMGMYFSDGYYDYDAAYTNIRFYPDYEYARHGTGEQVDYFSSPCPIRYQSFYFEWKVQNGRIFLYYPYDPDLNVVITEYHLNNHHFTGYIGSTYFQLGKLYDYYAWGLYGDNYYGYSYYDYYYAKSRSGQAENQLPSPENFSAGRRFGTK